MRLAAQFLSEITQKPRYMPDIEWARNSWVHNIFRSFEKVFGRRCGIRPEVSISRSENRIVYQFHSLEALFAHIETYIRSYRFEVPIRIWIPLLVTSTGLPMPLSPYLFAIAFDATAAATFGASPVTWTHTITGSNTLLWVTAVGQSVLPTDPTTYNSVNMTSVGSQTTIDAYNIRLSYLAAPTTGANTVSFTLSSGGGNGMSTSYSGCSQTGIPDASTTNTGTATTDLTTSVTTVADNSWTIICATGTQVTAVGTGGTSRQTQNTNCMGDSNAAITPAGSTSIHITCTIGNIYTVMASFAPTGGGATAVRPLLLSLLGIG